VGIVLITTHCWVQVSGAVLWLQMKITTQLLIDYKEICVSSTTSAIYSKGNTPKNSVGIGGGVSLLSRKPAISLKRGNIGLMLLLMTNRKLYTLHRFPFDSTAFLFWRSNWVASIGLSTYSEMCSFYIYCDNNCGNCSSSKTVQSSGVPSSFSTTARNCRSGYIRTGWCVVIHYKPGSISVQ